MSHPTMYQFHALVIEERKRQIAKGYDAAHDDEHGIDHLLSWAQDYARRGEPVKSAALIHAAREAIDRLAHGGRVCICASGEDQPRRSCPVHEPAELVPDVEYRHEDACRCGVVGPTDLPCQDHTNRSGA